MKLENDNFNEKDSELVAVRKQLSDEQLKENAAKLKSWAKQLIFLGLPICTVIEETGLNHRLIENITSSIKKNYPQQIFFHKEQSKKLTQIKKTTSQSIIDYHKTLYLHFYDNLINSYLLNYDENLSLNFNRFQAPIRAYELYIQTLKRTNYDLDLSKNYHLLFKEAWKMIQLLQLGEASREKCSDCRTIYYHEINNINLCPCCTLAKNIRNI